MVEIVVFAIAAAACLIGALGVVLSRNPVHAALMLVMTLFGIAVLFVALQAHFVAAVQVIVYAGAIVVLFLFVIMLAGVDRATDLSLDALPAQRWTAAVFGIGAATVLVWMVAATDRLFAGTRSYRLETRGALSAGFETGEFRADFLGSEGGSAGVAGAELGADYAIDISAIARSLFSDYLYAFELTSLLLIVAVIATVMVARGGYSRPSANPAQPTQPSPAPAAQPDSSRPNE